MILPNQVVVVVDELVVVLVDEHFIWGSCQGVGHLHSELVDHSALRLLFLKQAFVLQRVVLSTSSFSSSDGLLRKLEAGPTSLTRPRAVAAAIILLALRLLLFLPKRLLCSQAASALARVVGLLLRRFKC